MKRIIIFVFSFIFLSTGIVFSQTNSDVRSLLSSEGKILYGNEPNSVLVLDRPENIKKIEDYLAMIDTVPQQVLIEARVVEVKLQGENSLGINWSAFADKGGFEMGQFRVGSAINSALNQNIPYKSTYYPPGGTTAEATPFTVNIFDENINIVLQALANTYDTNILSAPRVTTVNNHTAEIKIVKKLPWAEPEVAVSDTGAATVTWSVNFEEVGITLNVTPTITEDGFISMELKPEVSEKTSDYELKIRQSGVDYPYNIPIIDKRSANTKVVIGNGQTFIIGGLIKETTIKGVTKVPLLGDIPLLGYFFKTKKDTKDKTELLIFVSPTLITPNVVADMQKKEEKITSWYTRENTGSDMSMLRIDKNKWDKIVSSLNSLETKVNGLVNKRKDLQEDINKEDSKVKK